uniref:Uracil phosphoribosyltransferase n=1 Tax=Rhodochaete parvula TaxID=110510 RepID=A0A1X9PUY5_9RHOD|nr:uracil phosphoribosyltransferase [Rhodochaete parvula]ASK39596.1 uracil phosphoribosyltransferase or UMP pyrophosphorylase [Rhodochaete parvula]
MQLQIYVPNHPLIRHAVNLIQSIDLPAAIIRTSIIELSYWLIYESVKDWLDYSEIEINTLYAVKKIKLIDPKPNLYILPLIKSGLVMTEGINKLLNNVKFLYITFSVSQNKIQISEQEKEAIQFPQEINKFLILDTVVIKSEKILTILSLLVDKGVDLSLVRLVFIICTPFVLADIGRLYPNLTIYAAYIDNEFSLDNQSVYDRFFMHLYC